jgi:hypothetical protein
METVPASPGMDHGSLNPMKDLQVRALLNPKATGATHLLSRPRMAAHKLPLSPLFLEPLLPPELRCCLLLPTSHLRNC